MNAKTPSKPSLDGSLTVEDLSKMSPPAVSAMGKQAIRDIGARYRQIVGLKPGSSSIRTPEMITELLERLIMGESVTSICCSDHMPALTTLWYWCRADEKLDDDYKWAQAMGQRTLKDLEVDIASGGVFSTGDARRDELLIKVIDKNASQRNRAEFGERVQVEHSRVVVNMPDWAVSVASSVASPPPEDAGDD